MRKSSRSLAIVAVAVHAAPFATSAARAESVLPDRVAVAAAAPCTIDGPAREYAVRPEEFGRRPITTQDDDGYWNGAGYLFGYQQQDREGMMSSPRRLAPRCSSCVG